MFLFFLLTFLPRPNFPLPVAAAPLDCRVAFVQIFAVTLSDSLSSCSQRKGEACTVHCAQLRAGNGFRTGHFTETTCLCIAEPLSSGNDRRRLFEEFARSRAEDCAAPLYAGRRGTARVDLRLQPRKPTAALDIGDAHVPRRRFISASLSPSVSRASAPRQLPMDLPGPALPLLHSGHAFCLRERGRQNEFNGEGFAGCSAAAGGILVPVFGTVLTWTSIPASKVNSQGNSDLR